MTKQEHYRRIRLWVYSVAVAVGPIVTFYGLADSNEVALWLGLGATILGTPVGTTAMVNLTPVDEPKTIEEALEVVESEESESTE